MTAGMTLNPLIAQRMDLLHDRPDHRMRPTRQVSAWCCSTSHDLGLTLSRVVDVIELTVLRHTQRRSSC